MAQTVSLIEMLDARERRVFRQQALLRTYQAPLICFTMNIAGPVKNSPEILDGFQVGCIRLEQQLNRAGLAVLCTEAVHEHTGNEIFYAVDAPAMTLKRITTDIEDGSPLGRLYDMDVLYPNGEKVDRSELNLPGRVCLICGKPGKDCARSRTHTVAELQAKTAEILREGVTDFDSRLAASLAVRSLLYEVCTAVKPGLVDRFGNGSHRDMDIFTFMNSAAALSPYFEACVRIGRCTAAQPPKETFLALRKAGIQAEGEMLAATNNVNTHKGAVFSMGILCGALGRLPRRSRKQPEAIADTVSQMLEGLTATDFAGITEENAKTVGQKLFVRYGITGVRGQAEAGFPAVLETGLPVLEQGLAAGKTVDEAGCGALLAMLCKTVDTNLIARSNLETQQAVSARIARLIADNPYPDTEALRQLDRQFVEKNLSPGGSADLLAACYFLHFLKEA